MVRFCGILLVLLVAALLPGCRFARVGERNASDSLARSRARDDRARVTRLDLSNVDSLAGPSSSGPSCAVDSDTVVCRASEGREDRFLSWTIPETPDHDGDQAKFRVVGPWRGNGAFQVLRADLGHDSPSYLLWETRVGGWILLQPGHDTACVGPRMETLLVRRLGGDNTVHWDYWTGIGGRLSRFSCGVPRGALRVDSLLWWVGPDGGAQPLDMTRLQDDPRAGCAPAEPLLENILPGYLEKPLPPPVQDQEI